MADVQLGHRCLDMDKEGASTRDDDDAHFSFRRYVDCVSEKEFM